MKILPTSFQKDGITSLMILPNPQLITKPFLNIPNQPLSNILREMVNQHIQLATFSGFLLLHSGVWNFTKLNNLRFHLSIRFHTALVTLIGTTNRHGTIPFLFKINKIVILD